MTKTQRRLEHLDTLGFDESSVIRGGLIRVKCSRCEALTINSIATHEHGCPNAMHECHGCNAIVPARVRYCAECQ